MQNLDVWTCISDIKIGQSLIHCEKTKLSWAILIDMPSCFGLKNKAPCGIDVTQRNGCMHTIIEERSERRHWGIKTPPKSGFVFSATWNDLFPILPPLSHHGMTWNYSCSAWKMHHFEWCYISVASQDNLAHFLDSTVFSPKMNKNDPEKISLHLPLMPLCSI